VPTYEATRELLAPVHDVWAFVAEPFHLADWWPGISGVQPDRRGAAAGARWQVVGDGTPTLLRRARATDVLVIHEAQEDRRFAFELVGQKLDVELELAEAGAARTKASLVVSAPMFAGLFRSPARQALDRLHALVQTGVEDL
jgi:uncharacterized protein YndB with AHSA1/START domain